jgi:asparagine synthase (glutamine-hydrolysing)
MLSKISHRGSAGKKVKEVKSATIGLVCTESQAEALPRVNQGTVADKGGDGHLALAKAREEGLILKRDPLGIAPLYYGKEDGAVYFASEVKALLPHCSEIKQVPPGHKTDGESVEPYYKLKKKEPFQKDPEVLAKELFSRLDASVRKRIELGGMVGSWLSGGLDSSTMVALARPYLDKLHTFAAGLPGAPDLEYASQVADFVQADHHEVLVSFQDLISVLPEVIYYLESFDALLVRSSLTNYLAAKEASEYVDAVLSGEGGDELFAGYEYLKTIDQDDLSDELIDITRRLHNTALQRVDRSAAANGTVPHVGFLDPDVVELALRIPIQYKLQDGVEKWILREAMQGKLPEQVLKRKKAKFWQGAGVGELLSEYADKMISDEDFRQDKNIPSGWTLRTKEELMYYRIFKDHFGELDDLSWMGRTKGAPAH